MNELKIVEQRELLGKHFVIYGDFENPLFLAKDVAEWIEYDKTSINKMLNNVDEDEKLNGTIFLAGQNREVSFLTEDGLYEVLMQSRKPIAKQFKKEVKKILKTIRTNGLYVTDKLLDNPDLAIRTFMKLKEEREKNLILERKIEEDKPKVDFYNKVASSPDTIDMLKVSRLLNIKGFGRNKIFALLREKGILMKNNVPYQKYINDGWFDVIECECTYYGKYTKIYLKTVVTQKGLQKLTKLLSL